MRALAILVATVPVAASGLQGLIVLFLLNVCMDACDGTALETDPGESAFLIAVVGAVFATALVFWWFVAVGNAGRATTWFVVQALVALGLLAFWVTESSDSDSQLLGIGLGVELAALLALLLCREDARRRAQPL